MTDANRAFEATEFLFGAQAAYIESLYEQYLQNNTSLPESWQQFFEGLDPNREGDLDAALKKAEELVVRENPELDVYSSNQPSANDQLYPLPPGATYALSPSFQHTSNPNDVSEETLDSIRALMLIRAYRVRGHLYAKLDPLGLEKTMKHPELEPDRYGFGPNDLDRPIYIDNLLGKKTASIREILKIVQDTYCDTVGVEFMHIQEADQKSWIQEHFENLNIHRAASTDTKIKVFEGLMHAEMFEKFLNIKYPGAKRFGLDGGESFIPCMNEVIERSAELGVKECVIGMAHRGRLNVLANIMEKPLPAIFHEFQGNSSNPDDVQGDGDVKYHLGASADRHYGNNTMHLSLTPNPSHLEAVDPIVLGKVRSKQDQRKDISRSQVMGILIHGDASFAGQGLVAECLDLSELQGYKTGGTIHIIINNQIGFTTKPSDSRSSPYCSDLAKAVQAPILHVNGDDPESVFYVALMAAEFRHKFKKDIVIDMYCYRRHGHNEGDEPMFTQPAMYKAIAKHQTTFTKFREKLIKDGVLSENKATEIEKKYKEHLEKCFEDGKKFKAKTADWLAGKWQGISVYERTDKSWISETGIPLKELESIGKKLSTVPNDFNAHSKIKRFLDSRAKMFESGQGIDWATGEALAFGSLLVEGKAVRLSGQDCGRGTFSQRHSVLHDQENNSKYIPLQHLDPKQANFEVIDSPLAEVSVLGFEYGYSSAEPNALVMWEAQFGDFANGAQVIVDQFISSGESKWLRMNGLVMLLPHGYEGQGPEHSSARIERYLQLCAEDNIQVVNCTTPANYFHVLRRQLHRDFRKPLIIFTPKSLLRHKACVSKLDDFKTGTSFNRVIGEIDASIKPQQVDRVVVCSGKVYFDLMKEREDKKIKNVAIVRLEQYYPFPFSSLKEELKKYSNHIQLIWCQEEPSNMGAWWFVDRRLETVLYELDYRHTRPFYVGRKEAASTSTGLLKRHTAEQEALVQHAISGPLDKHHTRIKI